MTTEYDYIVIGAGSSGCLLANRLSGDPGNSVLLIDAGGRNDGLLDKVPMGLFWNIGRQSRDWCYRSAPQPNAGGRVFPLPKGKGLGGSSNINGMVYIRGQAADYDDWARNGCEGWDWSSLRPYFRKFENHWAGASAHHGASGEYRIERATSGWPIIDAFFGAADELGIPRIDDFNRGDNFGVSYFDVTQNAGRRHSAADAFLRPILKTRRNLHVLLQTQANRIKFDDDKRARFVVVNRAGAVEEIGARREIILSAGAIGSPHLLQVSGVGDADLLRAHGVDIVHHNPAVGANLQDHLSIRPSFRVTGARTLNSRARGISGKLGIAMEYLLSRSGPLAMAPGLVGIFARSSTEVDRADLQFHVQPFSMNGLAGKLDQHDAVTLNLCDLRPESRGSVRLSGPAIDDAPLIDPNYLGTDRDRTVIVNAIGLARKLMSTQALKAYDPVENWRGASEYCPAEMLAHIAASAISLHHHVGTCRMGSDEKAVVRPDLKVAGVSNLRVADASIMPRIVSGNTHAPTMMVAERAADLILGTGHMIDYS